MLPFSTGARYWIRLAFTRSVVLHDLPPSDEVPRLGEIGYTETDRVLREALGKAILDVERPAFSAGVGSHGAHELKPLGLPPAGMIL